MRNRIGKKGWCFAIVLFLIGAGTVMTINAQSTQIVQVSEGTSVTVYERTSSLYVKTFTLSTLQGPGGTFSTAAAESYKVTSDGTYLLIECWRPSRNDVGNNIVAVRLNGVPGYPDGIWATDIIDYTLGPDGVESHNPRCLGNDMSTHTHIGDVYSSITLGFSIEASVIEISIDIKPGSYPNSINPKSKGNVPVAILTTDVFDASDVEPDTIVFLDAAPIQWAMDDVDFDGDLDMILHFKTQELDFDLLVDEGGEYPYAYLTGETNEGQSIEGKDTVRLVGPLQMIFETIFARVIHIFERIVQLFT